jgi:hypothetical protein
MAESKDRGGSKDKKKPEKTIKERRKEKREKEHPEANRP